MNFSLYFTKFLLSLLENILQNKIKKNFLNAKKKKIYKTFYFQVIPVFFLGLFIGVTSIWPGIISENSRKCFFNILLDGSDGSVRVGTLLSINSSYLLKIKNTKNKYLKILFIGDSCFRKFK